MASEGSPSSSSPASSSGSSPSDIKRCSPRSRKQREFYSDSVASNSDHSFSGSKPREKRRLSVDLVHDDVPWASTKRPRLLQSIVPPPATYPASAFKTEGSKPTPTQEMTALSKLKEEWLKQNPDATESDCIMLELTDFTIYRPKTIGPEKVSDKSWEMESLQFLRAKSGVDCLLFDGFASYGTVSFYLQAVPFSSLAVEGYNDLDAATTLGRISVQSLAAEEWAPTMWYRLKSPSPRYQRFYTPFLWIADFTKHVVDFIGDKEGTSLFDFKRKFRDWLKEHHGSDLDFQRWIAQVPFTDFRQTLVANWDFLRKELHGLDGDEMWKLQVCKDICSGDLIAIPEQKSVEKKTVVMPLIHECFKNMYFSKELRESEPEDAVKVAHVHRLSSMNFPCYDGPSANASVDDLVTIPAGKSTVQVKVGDFIAVPSDTVSKWKNPKDLWFAYVQDIKQKGGSGRRYLNVIWVYRPSETTLGDMVYPNTNELFFSDNCNCRESAMLREDEVVCKLKVAWSTDPKPDEIVIRQKFMSRGDSFVTITEDNMLCECRQKKAAPKTAMEQIRREYRIGDAVYVSNWFCPKTKARASSDRLKPVVIVAFEEDVIRVRHLPRRCEIKDNEHREPNELVWTDTIINVYPKKVQGRCQIRFFTAAQVATSGIPTPHDRKGNGHYWFITSKKLPSKSVEDLTLPFPVGLTQGHLQDVTLPKLRGMDLFCGGGNFGRGLEEGGAATMDYAVDFNKFGMHTYRANMSDPESPNSTKLWLGNVNDYMRQALRGVTNPLIAKVGDIDFIAGGSPCTGFSSSQPDRMSAQSLKNSSLITSFATFVELYRPRYALFENVEAVTRTMPGPNGEKQNVFQQLLCCFVAMGYQVTYFLLDPWSFGASQSRRRLFIALAGPGLRPIEHPRPSHAHPDNTPSRSLGKGPNGEGFGHRRFDLVPFPLTTVDAAVSDLPYLGDGKTGTCVPFPCHRVPVVGNSNLCSMIAAIPTVPRRCTLKQAAAAGLMSPRHLAIGARWTSAIRTSAASKAWSRIDPAGVFPAVTTALVPSDGIHGRTLHPRQHRTITLMEARRAQGVPDGEVLVGRMQDQWRTVGNAVCRQVALALGVALREAVVEGGGEWRVGRAKGANGDGESPF